MRVRVAKQGERPWLTAFALLATLLVAARAYAQPLLPATHNTDSGAEISELASSWVGAVADQSPLLVDLLASGAAQHYDRLRVLALEAAYPEIATLEPMDQLQVLFLRLQVAPGRLEAMSPEEILLHAIAQQWIGRDLRRNDELHEIVIGDATATGRLYKFGKADRRDRGLQYFVREDGAWRVDLRGERERLRREFEDFVKRSGLSPSEAAFFILETRLMRKVTPIDFLPPGSLEVTRIRPREESRGTPLPASLRLVALRRSPGNPSLGAATFADPAQSLRYLVRVGEEIPDGSGDRLLRVSDTQAWVEQAGGMVTFALDPDGPALDERPARPPSETVFSLLEQARLGEHRPGMMSQWRNAGLRGRAQLLQQGWLTPEFGSDREEMKGLRVRKLVPGSFWNQIGLREGDLLVEANGSSIDSLERWRGLLENAESDRKLTVIVLREGDRLQFDTRTVSPHASGDPT